MDCSNKHFCKIHEDLPILFYCTDSKCNINNAFLNENQNTHKQLCEICLNLHDKSHKYIVSSNSIFDETYEKMVYSNIEKANQIKSNIEKLNKVFTEQINKEFKNFSEQFYILMEKSKADLINTIELQKNKSIEEIEIWKEIKIKLDKISPYNVKTIKYPNLNLHINENFENSIEIDDSKFIPELNFFGCDKKNNSNTDINLSCISKEENTKDNINIFNLNTHIHNPSSINNLNSQNFIFNTNSNIPGSNNLFFTNVNFNLPNFNVNSNTKNFLENKLKLISTILEKHIEQFVENNYNFDRNLKNKFQKENSLTNNNNNFKFSNNVKSLFKNFTSDFDFKLKSLIDTHLPFNVYRNITNFNYLNNKNEIININNNLNQNPQISNKPNGVYDNELIKNKLECIKNETTQQNSSKKLNPNDDCRDILNNNNVNNEKINCKKKEEFIKINSPTDKYNSEINKRIGAYGNKKNIVCDRETFIFDANGVEYSPKNSMILNFNSTKNNENFNNETLKNLRDPVNKINIQNDTDIPSELKNDADFYIKEYEDTLNLNNFDINKKINKISKNKRVPSINDEDNTNDYNCKIINNFESKSKKEKKNILLRKENKNDFIEEKNIKYLDNNQKNLNLKNQKPMRSVSYVYNTKKNNFADISHDNDNMDKNYFDYKNILEDKNINSVLSNIRKKSFNIFPLSNANLKKVNYSEKNLNCSNFNIETYKLINNYENDQENLLKPYLNNSKMESSKDEIDNLIKNDLNEKIPKNSIKPFEDNRKNSFDKLSLIKNFNHRSFELSEPKDILTSKKGSWYSLDYIHNLNYLVCGFENGEIVIFRESDLGLIRTYRPRFKRIRKLMYSHENSSIFACYDDGFFIMINLLDYKFESFKKSENQIYTFDIMKNYNILIWGGYDRKIMFSYINNMNVTQLFWESNHGEIQSLYHDIDTDVLVVSLRKNKVVFFDFINSSIIKQYSIEENDDACGMVIKKYEFSNHFVDNNEIKSMNSNTIRKNKKSTILISGFFMCIHQFEISINEDNKQKIDFIRYIKTPYTHIYDIFFINLKYFMISTFEEGKIVLMDYEDNKIIKVFEHFYKAVLNIKLVNNKFYLTSHSDYLKKVDFTT